MKKKSLIIMIVMSAILFIACGKSQEKSLGEGTPIEVMEETAETESVEVVEETAETEKVEVVEETAEAEKVEEKSNLDLYFELFEILFYGVDENNTSFYYMLNSTDMTAVLINVSENEEVISKMEGTLTMNGGIHTITNEKGESFSFACDLSSEIVLEDGRSVKIVISIDPELAEKAMDYYMTSQ